MSRPWARCAASTRAGGPWCSRAARASPWTTSPTLRCFRAGRKPGGPQKQAAQPGRLRRFCRGLFCARRAKERGRLCHGRGRAAPHRREQAGPGARGRRAHPPGRPLRPRAALEQGRKQALPKKQAAQPGRLRRFCRDLLRARRAKERGRLCHGRGRPAPHRRMRAGPGARGRRAHPPGRPLRPRAALERDGNQAVPQNRRRSPGGCAAFAANDFVPGARDGVLRCFRAGRRADRAGCPGTGARPGRRPGTSSRPGRPRPRAPGTAGGSTGCCPAC